MTMTATTLPIAVSGALTSARSREHVTRQLERALGRFGQRIERITVRCRDVNGLRGGVDQACRIEVALRGLPRIVVEKIAETPRAAFDLAAPAAKRALRRALERGSLRSGGLRGEHGPESGTPEPAAPRASEDGSLICRRVGRSAQQLRRVAERPEKLRRDVFVDTSLPGTSASDRKVGAGSTARRNTKLARRGMTSLLEDSARSRPSRKSTRRSVNRAKRDGNLRLRATNRARRSKPR
jgi:ribosome-associated translation inhibitor RaiA